MGINGEHEESTPISGDRTRSPSRESIAGPPTSPRDNDLVREKRILALSDRIEALGPCSETRNLRAELLQLAAQRPAEMVQALHRAIS